MENKQYENGIAPDPRTEEEIAKDYKHEDMVGAITLNWVEKTPDQWKKYVPREQDGSLSCCGQGAAKAIEILGGIVESAHPIYRARANFPGGGMYQQNVGDVCKNRGTTHEFLDPSQNEGESVMNRDITVETPIKIDNYVQLTNPKDIDKIAEAIELYKHCILIVHANHSEWTAIPTFQDGLPIDFGHCICAVDYFIHNGIKAILIEDSTGHFNSLDGNGQRLITEDFLKERFEGAMYFIKHGAYKFTQTLKRGSTGLEVEKLQERLMVKIDGKFGIITATAVRKFQAENGLVPDGVVGVKTRAKLNA